ncbi:MAG: hypothetical protein HWN80_20755, partial [Candidatus Lokiarchaeota archaeon]|nr:hypothetical protein [Candidatus Lokiarchaeota archaeon]
SFHLVKNPELQEYSYSLWAERYYKLRIQDLPLYAVPMPFKKPSEVIDINFSTSFHFSRIGWSERSSEALKLILEFYPQDIEILNALGYSYVLREQYLEAKESLDKVLSIAKENFMTNILLGGLYRRTGKYKESSAVFNRLIQNLNNNFPLDNSYNIQLYVNKDNAKDV